MLLWKIGELAGEEQGMGKGGGVGHEVGVGGMFK